MEDGPRANLAEGGGPVGSGAGGGSRVRIGVIGCGGRAGSHIQAFSRGEGSTVVAVADVAEAAARAAGERWSVPWYTDHQELLRRDDLDAVVVCVPVFAHGQIELDVISRGLPFLVDKPVSRDLGAARRVQSALEAAGLWACVGYQLRYLEPVRRARAFLAGQTVAVADGHYWCGTGRSGSWHNDWQRSGGQLVEQATHTVDLMRHLVGEVEEVYAQQARRVVTGITSPDTYTVALRFEGGALGSLSTTWAHDPGDWSNANILHVVVDGRLLRVDGSGAGLLPAGRGDLPEAPGPDMYTAFCAGVRSGQPTEVLSSYADGVATLAGSLAANASAQAHRPVRLSEGLEA